MEQFWFLRFVVRDNRFKVLFRKYYGNINALMQCLVYKRVILLLQPVFLLHAKRTTFRHINAKISGAITFICHLKYFTVGIFKIFQAGFLYPFNLKHSAVRIKLYKHAWC